MVDVVGCGSPLRPPSTGRLAHTAAIGFCLTFVWTPYALPFLIACLLGVALMVYVARHRETSVGPAFVTLLAVISTWMGLEGLIVLGADLDTKLLIGRACYPPLMAIAPALVLVARTCNDPGSQLKAWQWAFMLSVPTIGLPLLFVDPVPGPYYQQAWLDPEAPYARRVLVRGPFFYLLVAHSYLLVAWATWLFARRTRRTWRVHGVDGALMIAGVFVPWVAVSLHVLGFDLLPHLEATPFGFVGMALLLYLGFKRTGLLGVVGVGRHQVVDVMRDGVLVTDLRGLVLDANAAALEILAIRSSNLVGAEVQSALSAHPQLLEGYRSWMEGRLGSVEVTAPVEGCTRTFDLDVSNMTTGIGRVVCHVLVLRDVTDRKRAEGALERESEFLHLIQHVAMAANDARTVDGALEAGLKIICDTMHWPMGHVCRPVEGSDAALLGTSIRYVSPDPENLEWLERSPLRRITHSNSAAYQTLISGKPMVATIQPSVRRKLQEEMGIPMALHAVLSMPVLLDDQVPAVLEFASDAPIEAEEELLGVFAHLGDVLGRVMERKRNEERIRELAYFDGLTGLPNRELFLYRLTTALDQARVKNRSVGLLFVDLDGFKRVNDTLGHSAGDALLRQVGARFASSMRSGDVMCRTSREHENSLSRLGGDEFTVLLAGISAPEDASLVAERLIASLSEPFEVAGAEVFAGASIGIAIHPGDGDTAEDLLSSADVAMYAAKGRGAGGTQFYSESMNRRSRQRLELEGQLRQALEREELSLVYQPFRSARSGELVAVEALLRWELPGVGPVSPVEFIPIAERSALIIPIGDWVLETACTQAVLWREQGGESLRVAVNVSGIQIRQGGFAQRVETVLASSGLSAAQLEIEITESAIWADDPVTLETLDALHALGVGLALDDFGTGTSSLTHLRRFPIDRVKVDRAFVSGVPENPQDSSLTAAIIGMAHGLGLAVVAEGVETEEQARFLTHHGCDELQGFLLSRPLAPSAISQLLAQEKPD